MTRRNTGIRHRQNLLVPGFIANAHRGGASVRVLEASDRIGGVILNEQIDGFTIDAGPDSLLVQKPEAIALCRELGLGDRLVTRSRALSTTVWRTDAGSEADRPSAVRIRSVASSWALASSRSWISRSSPSAVGAASCSATLPLPAVGSRRL